MRLSISTTKTSAKCSKSKQLTVDVPASRSHSKPPKNVSIGSLDHIERWWSAQGLACRKEGRRSVGNLSSLASYYVLVYTCRVTTRYQ